MKKRVLIGIAGGTASGKTTLAKEIGRRVRGEVVIIEQDAYYKDLSHLPLEERKKVNYDHPSAFDMDLLVTHIRDLLDGKPIRKPVYSFELYTRLPETVLVKPKDVIILEGILIFEDKRLRDMMDVKIYIDTDPDIRFIRRLMRDVKERGRTLDDVVNQYLSTVRPMHLEFVEPAKRYADIIIPGGGKNEVALDIIVAKINQILEGGKK